MPEGVHGYPRWRGELSQGSAIPVIVREELRRALNSFWVQGALLLLLAITIVYLGSLSSLSRRPGATHTVDVFFTFLTIVLWLSLAVAAVIAGPILLEDRRRGAMELYLSRAVTPLEYLGAKAITVFGVAFLAVLIPSYLYYAATFFMFQTQPETWTQVALGIPLFALLWAAMVAGLGLGLSSLVRSSVAATILLLATFAVVEVFTKNIFVSATTRLIDFVLPDGSGHLLSPFSALMQNRDWIFGSPGEFAFPSWWGLVVVVSLAVVGWGVMIWKRPRIAGVE